MLKESDNVMKKIVIISNNSSGLYKFRKELLIRLIQKDYYITVITPFDEMVDELKLLGVKLIELSLERRGKHFVKDLGLFFNYFKIIKEEFPELIITYTIKPNIYAGLAARCLCIPYVANITGLGTAFQRKNYLHLVVSVLYRISLKNAKKIFFENDENCKFFKKERIAKKEQCCILKGAGVNLEYYSQQPYPIKENEIHFLFIGRIMKEKGIDELLEATRRLYFDGQNCVLNIVGTYEENYEAVIKDYEKEGWIQYHGYKKDIRPYIKFSHCFVLPSYHEGMANTNLESAASGRPLIVSDIPGCREAIIENVSGFLCKPQNVDSLYNVMKTFMNLSWSEKKRMGIEGRKHMEKMFDKRIVVEETINALGI